MVPEGWRDACLGELVQLQRGHDLPAQDRIDGRIPIIGGGGPNGFHNVARAKAPGIVIGRSGSGIGNAFWCEEAFWPLNTGLYVTDFLGNDPRFCFLWLDWIDFTPHNTGGAQPSLNRNFIYPIPIPLPPLAEQKRIAEVLGVWDRAIEVAGKQLDLARTQKRALMQTLLTPTRRFPGYEGQPWKEVRLGDVAEIIVSNVDKKSDQDEPTVRLCNYMDVYRHDTITPDMPFMESTASKVQIERFGLKVGDVLITKDSETPQDIAIPSYVEDAADDLVCGYHLAIIRPKKMVFGRFLKSIFETPETRYFFSTRANGATRFGLTIAAIENAPMKIPSLEEQKRITDMLRASEVEITILETQITRLNAEKKALMQQLLTGKKRVR